MFFCHSELTLSAFHLSYQSDSDIKWDATSHVIFLQLDIVTVFAVWGLMVRPLLNV